jgi:uncharacterized protein
MTTATLEPSIMSDESSRRLRARRGLGVYFAVLLLTSGALQALLLRAGDAIQNHEGLVLALMWTPALASLLSRVVVREHPRDVSFGFGGKRGLRGLGQALAFPLLVGGLSYGLAWAAGLERFEPPASHLVDATPLFAFFRSLLLQATLGALIGCLSAAGEEIGWRGYMLTRLIDGGVRRPVLVSGLVWALWHVPLIVSGQYAAGRYPLLSALLFVPSVTCAGYIAARLRLVSGSVWPAVFFHAAWNAIIQSSFDRYTAGGSSHGHTLWTGESGILVVGVSVLVVLLVLRFDPPFALRRTVSGAPGEPVRLRDL